MKLEKFEQEYGEEIKKLQALKFSTVQAPEFKVPAYKFIYTRALSFAFAVPALALVFGFFFYNPQSSAYNQDLAQIEASNARILNQINTLDNESI